MNRHGTLLERFLGCMKPGFLYISLHAVPACQALDTQLKALPTLPVLARTASGCLSSGNLDISRQFAAPACQADDSRLGALPTLHVIAPGAGKTNPRRSCLCHREVSEMLARSGQPCRKMTLSESCEWSLTIRCEKCPARCPSRKAARGASALLHAETNPPGLRVVRVVWK